jgi:RHS repeat-associated protein
MTSQTCTTRAVYGYVVFKEQFTGKERDAETGLDYFGARYMSATQGRFTNPDLIKLRRSVCLVPQTP